MGLRSLVPSRISGQIALLIAFWYWLMDSFGTF